MLSTRGGRIDFKTWTQRRAQSRLAFIDTHSFFCPNIDAIEAATRLPFDEGLTLVVLDSANACDTADPVTHAHEIYTAQFAKVEELIHTRYAWVVTHRPIWAAFVDSASVDCAKHPKDCDNATLQQAIKASPRGALPATVQLGLYGHMHYFEALAFDTPGRPPSLVIGDSGVELSGTPITSFTVEGVDGEPAHGVQLNRAGFFDIELSPDGTWQGQLFDRRSALAVCGSVQLTTTGRVCRLTGT